MIFLVSATLLITTERSFSHVAQTQIILAEYNVPKSFNGLAHLSTHKDVNVAPEEVLDIMAKKPRRIDLVPVLLFVSEVHSQPELQSGICLVNYTTRVPALEPYTYTKKVQIREFCGWKVCMKERIDHVTDKRYVYHDVVRQKPECCPGYEKIISYASVHGFVCSPVCDPLCVFGHCSSPGNCTCNDGYQHSTSNMCSPACQSPCVFGTCTSPNTCTCLIGYTKLNDSVCQPSCSSPCVHGQCISPNVCACDPGYKMHPTNHTLCEPHCENECLNSKCINPNECECIEGFEKQSYQPNVCKPSCSLECVHGDCTAPNECTCKEGYYLGNESWNNCLPDCNCTNGYCLEPNKCICHENYMLNEEGHCEPICDKCLNSTCTSPYVCECFEGFRQLNSTVCVPDCTNCEHGVCTEPEVCSCFEGYDNAGSTCEPICAAGCANGICTAPNTCKCDTDHDQVLENVCFPLCGSNCTNCNDSDTECIVTQQTKIFNFSPKNKSFLKLPLAVDCASLRKLENNSCTYSSYEEKNCSVITLECFAIKSTSTHFHFLCLWKDDDTYLETAFEEVVSETRLIEITPIFQGNIIATVLLPRFFMSGEGECELCSSSADTSDITENKVVFQMAPCPTGGKERVKMPAKEEDSSLLYIVIGVIAITTIALVALTIVILNKRRFREYIVNRTESLKHNMREEETEMLHPDLD